MKATKVTLRKKGKVIGELVVGEDGAVSLSCSSDELVTLSVKDSRRLAGVIIERSVQSTARRVRGDVARQAKAQIDALFPDVDDGER